TPRPRPAPPPPPPPLPPPRRSKSVARRTRPGGPAVTATGSWRTFGVTAGPRDFAVGSGSGRLGLGVPPGSFDELAVDEGGAGADQGDEVGCVDRPPAGLG